MHGAGDTDPSSESARIHCRVKEELGDAISESKKNAENVLLLPNVVVARVTCACVHY